MPYLPLSTPTEFHEVATSHARDSIPSVVRYFHEFSTPGSRTHDLEAYKNFTARPELRKIDFFDIDAELVKEHVCERNILSFPAYVLYTDEGAEELRVLREPEELWELRGGRDYEVGLGRLV